MSIRQQSSESIELLQKQQAVYLVIFLAVGFFAICFLATVFFLVVATGLRVTGLRVTGLRTAGLRVAGLWTNFSSVVSRTMPDVVFTVDLIGVIWTEVSSASHDRWRQISTITAQIATTAMRVWLMFMLKTLEASNRKKSRKKRTTG